MFGRQSLWPRQRRADQEGTAQALHTIEEVQLDPFNIVARSHHIVLWSRLGGYEPAYLHHLLYHARHFFDYGGGLCIYPMTELPFWRLHMRRREQEGRWADFAGQRVNNYRGGKDTALAFYYPWLTGELMIHHRQGFERVYDFREPIAPPTVDYVAPE